MRRSVGLFISSFQTLSYSFHRSLPILERRQNFSRTFPRHGKIVSAEADVTGAGQDILLQNIKSSTETSEILYSVRKHHLIMNDRHIMQAFRSIFVLQKTYNSDMSNGEVVKSTEFRILCKALNSRIQSLEIGEVLDVLKTLSFVGVPATSKIAQSLLQYVTKEVNYLSLEQLTFLDFLIKDFQPCPLVDALKIALPIVFEAQLTTKVDPESTAQLTHLLFYSSKKNLSNSTKDFLIEKLMKIRNHLDVKSATSIIKSVCDLRKVDESIRPLFHHALDIVVENSEQLNFHDFDSILSKLAGRYSLKNYFFYHEEFVNSAINYVVTGDAGFEEGIWILRKASKFGHIDLKLLDYLALKAEQSISDLKNCGTLILFSFVAGFAQADYRPTNWPTIEHAIIKNAASHINQVELPWLKFLKDLCTLDCWPFEIFEKVFKPEFLDKNLAREYNTLDYLQLLSLHQALSALCPWYNGQKVDDKYIEKAMELLSTKRNESPIKPFLVKGLGGERYLLSGVHTKLGHYIDHVVVMRKGGYPVAIGHIEKRRGPKMYLEDLPPFEDCQIVAVMSVPASSYCTNVDRLKGPFRLDLNSLEMIGPTVVNISLNAWDQLLEQEKIPYIMQAIKHKCDTDDLQHPII